MINFLTKMNKLLEYWRPIVVTILSIVAIVQCRQVKHIQRDNIRLQDNYYAICDTADVWRTKSGKLASKTCNLQLTINELNAMVSNLDSKLKDANLKAKSLTAYQHATITKDLHDTIILRDTVVYGVTAKRGSYHINCVDLTFLVSQDTAIFGYTSHDTVDVYISTEKVGKWWQIWKFPRKKNAVTTAISTCPDTRVTVKSTFIKK